MKEYWRHSPQVVVERRKVDTWSATAERLLKAKACISFKQGPRHSALLLRPCSSLRVLNLITASVRQIHWLGQYALYTRVYRTGRHLICSSKLAENGLCLRSHIRNSLPQIYRSRSCLYMLPKAEYGQVSCDQRTGCLSQLLHGCYH